MVPMEKGTKKGPNGPLSLTSQRSLYIALYVLQASSVHRAFAAYQRFAFSVLENKMLGLAMQDKTITSDKLKQLPARVL